MSPSPVMPGNRRGHLMPIGGAEDKANNPRILSHFLEICGGEQARIMIIPTASQLPETGPLYADLFLDLGAERALFTEINERSDCDDELLLEEMDIATGIFVTGGNQLRLSGILGGTPVGQKLRRRSAEGIPIGGTSAGAAMMSQHMIAGGSSGLSPREDGVNLAPGIGLINTAIIDQHFSQRDRLGRLLTALSYNPFLIGIGIDEDTAFLIDGDNCGEVIGSGAVTIIDASELSHSSRSSAGAGAAISLLDIRLHVLAEGGRYEMQTRQATIR
ncbi:MAG: cyanophycinase [Halieaceae bacterium]|jgi:cyanophycinase|nr:cyanophycinase [Halieaceae bacterium]